LTARQFALEALDAGFDVASLLVVSSARLGDEDFARYEQARLAEGKTQALHMMSTLDVFPMAPPWPLGFSYTLINITVQDKTNANNDLKQRPPSALPNSPCWGALPVSAPPYFM
jgi:hypothetical protein